MGYNGGTNKRGYYRRYNGMYSKSSVKSGSKLITNTILGGLGLISTIGAAIADSSIDSPAADDFKEKHFSAIKQRRKLIIGGILALLCPVAGFITFQYAYWWMFCSVLLFGFIELLIIFSITTVEGHISNEINYIYENEIESTTKACKTNRIILRVLTILLFVLNLYPIGMYICGLTYLIDVGSLAKYGWDGGETSIPTILILIKLAINILLIVESFRNGFVINNYGKILPVPQQENSTNLQTEDTNKSTIENTEHISKNFDIQEPVVQTTKNNERNSTVSENTDIEDSSLTQTESNISNDSDNKEEETITVIDHIVDPRILRIISSDRKLEKYYYFSLELLSEDSYNRQQFTPDFKNIWFTYNEYKSYWLEVHDQLEFYAKAKEIAIDIIKHDLITLKDFEDSNRFEVLRDELLKSRLTEKMYQMFLELKNSRTYVYDCIIFDFYRCRRLKLEYKADKDSVDYSIMSSFTSSVEKILKIELYGSYELNKLVEIIDEVKKDVPNTDSNPINQDELANKVTLPAISGEYVETFKSPYGNLHIHSTYASIRFYFPGPDARYRGTHFIISEEEIDKYIQAYKNNWELGKQLQSKAKETPNTELSQNGEMRMKVAATSRSFRIYLHHNYLPISDKKECEEMIMLLQRAKLRIKEVRSKLFE